MRLVVEGTRRLLVLLLLVAFAIAAAGPARVAPPRLAVAPHPFVVGHIATQTLKNPPNTAFCQATFGISCYAPAQYQRAYDLGPLYAQGFNGAGRTVVIVDSFGSPTIQADLRHFDQNYGLPDPPSFSIIAPAGIPPAFDPTNADMVSWAEETTLDVEWSHAMAPGANILLVTTPTDETEGVQGFPEIVAAENYVIDHNLGDVISQSFGATEETFPSPQAILGLRSAFVNAQKHHVTVLAASGDQGATDLKSDTSCCYPMRVNSWPSADPLVTSVGGTQLHLDAAGNRLAPDEVWNDGYGAGGGGLSAVFERPHQQQDVRGIVGDQRGTPDISMSAAVDGAAIVYWSFSVRPGWHLIGGTSEASPLFAGVVAIADQMAGQRLGLLNGRLYTLLHQPENGLVDVTIGNNSFTFCASSCGTAQEVDTTVTGFNAAPGYDLASGLGTIDAARFVPALAHSGDTGDNAN